MNWSVYNDLYTALALRPPWWKDSMGNRVISRRVASVILAFLSGLLVVYWRVVHTTASCTCRICLHQAWIFLDLQRQLTSSEWDFRTSQATRRLLHVAVVWMGLEEMHCNVDPVSEYCTQCNAVAPSCSSCVTTPAAKQTPTHTKEVIQVLGYCGLFNERVMSEILGQGHSGGNCF